MKISYAKAIQSIDKELSFTIYNDDLDNIVYKLLKMLNQIILKKHQENKN